jgi:AraC-like DNA-binding protein
MAPETTTINLRWVSDPGPYDILIPQKGIIEDNLPIIPPKSGTGMTTVIKMPFDLTLIRGTHHFLESARGQWIECGRAKAQCDQPVLFVQTVMGCQVFNQFYEPEKAMLISPGEALFAHAERLEYTPILEAKAFSEVYGLLIGIGSMKTLLGDDETAQLLKKMGIPEPPRVQLQPLHKNLCRVLVEAFSDKLTGPARVLYAQSRVLEFLSGLYTSFCPQSGELPSPKNKIEEVYDYLDTLEGENPTLADLALRLGVSGRRLNEDFTRRYGESVSSFLYGRRLDQSRESLIHTDLPMKGIAANLGYSHVNHFISAFRKRFGVTPGSLRRRS